MEITISNINVARVAADLLILKHADGFHGADLTVAKALGFSDEIARGDVRFLPGLDVAAQEVAFVGVGPLEEFRYERIQDFGTRAVELARTGHRTVTHMALTVHGPGYGLDLEQAFLSLTAGLIAGLKGNPGLLQKITIAELSAKRCDLLRRILEGRHEEFGLSNTDRGATVTFETKSITASSQAAKNVIQFGTRAEEMPRLFVAMPFADDFIDEFQIGFCEAAKFSSYICERLDLESFTGDIVSEIKKRILDSHGVIALVNGHNPNVFLEIGFALAHNKPTLLVAKEGVPLPFDVSSQRCIRYKNIVHLREVLSREITALKERGILAISA